MNRLIGIFLILLFSITLFGAKVTNADKPLKGTWNFNPEKLWEVTGVGEDPLVMVRRFRVDDEGNTYLFDDKFVKFHVFDPEGKHMYSFGKKGEGPGEFRMVMNFFINAGNLIVYDFGKLHYFDKKTGTFLKAVTLGSMMDPMPRAFIDPDRFITLPDAQGGKSPVQVYDINAKKRETILEIGAEKPMEVNETQGNTRMMVRIIDPSTQPGVVLALKDNVYVGKSDDYSIKVVDMEGKERLSFSLEGREPRKIPMEYKKNRVAGFVINGHKPSPEMAKQIISGIPDYGTLFNRIMVDEKGYIYVFVTDLGKSAGREIDIFSPEGKYLYRSEVALPEGYTIRGRLVFQGDSLYALAEDDEENLKLVKYRIKTI